MTPREQSSGDSLDNDRCVLDHGADRSRWLSGHLYFRGAIYGSECDLVLREVVAPLFRWAREGGHASCAFFIRYRDEDSHVRVRVLPTSVDHAGGLRSEIETRWGNFQCDGVGRALAAPRQVVWNDYQPEYARYGGSSALSVAERLFDASSALVLEYSLHPLSPNRSVRLGRALLAMLTMTHVMFGSVTAVQDFARRYSYDYLRVLGSPEESRTLATELFDAAHHRQAADLRPFVDQAVMQLQGAESLSQPLDAYRDAVAGARRDLQALVAARQVTTGRVVLGAWDPAIRYLCPSYVHMTSNRLGVSILEEAFLARVLYLALDAKH